MTFHRDAWVVDVHTHGLGMLPAPIRHTHRLISRTTMPPDETLGVFAAASVDAAVVKAVGDPPVTRWYRGSAFDAVTRQLASLREQAVATGGHVVTTSAELDAARAAGATAVVLGLEGADAIGDEPHRVDALAAAGVRVVGIIHLGHNQLGTTSMPWLQYVGAFPARRPAHTGLTPLGRDVVTRLEAANIVIDLAHADAATTLDVVGLATRAVISSHAGAGARPTAASPASSTTTSCAPSRRPAASSGCGRTTIVGAASPPWARWWTMPATSPTSSVPSICASGPT